jgi:hypothetical protein
MPINANPVPIVGRPQLGLLPPDRLGGDKRVTLFDHLLDWIGARIASGLTQASNGYEPLCACGSIGPQAGTPPG